MAKLFLVTMLVETETDGPHETLIRDAIVEAMLDMNKKEELIALEVHVAKTNLPPTME